MNRPLLVITALTLGLVGLAGCSTRRILTIETRPPGARIWVNGELQSRPTPVEVPFTHYGRFDVRIEKDGYESLNVEIVIPAKLDGYPVIDIFLEAGTRERRFRRAFDLQPIEPNPTETDLLEAARSRAEAFRERTIREVEEADPPKRTLP